MAAEKYFPFRSVSGDRKYSAEDWAAYFALFLSDGVCYSSADRLKVVVNEGMKVRVITGAGFIAGRMYMLETDKTITLDTADGALNRIDRIVLRCDYTSRKMGVEVVKGSYSEKPTAPALTRNADIYELALADVYVAAGVISVTQSNITDQRLNTSLCGIVTGLIDQADTTEIFNQFNAYLAEFKQTSGEDFDAQINEWDAEFNAWFAEIKAALEGDIATELAARIVALEDGTKPAGKATNAENAEKFGNLLPSRYYKSTILKDNAFKIDANTLVDEGNYFIISGVNVPPPGHGFISVQYYNGALFAPVTEWGTTKCVRQRFYPYGNVNTSNYLPKTRYGLLKTNITTEWEFTEWVNEADGGNAKTVNGVTLYKDFAEIDSAFTQNTPIIDVVLKMAYHSKFATTIYNPTSGLYPTSNGALEIVKTISGAHATLRFIDRGTNKSWHGLVQVNGSYWSGWLNDADGGNADTVDGYHASDFYQKKTNSAHNTTADPNTTEVARIRTKHANCPTADVEYIIDTTFTDSTADTYERRQTAYGTGGNNVVYNRAKAYGGSWTNWERTITSAGGTVAKLKIAKEDDNGEGGQLELEKPTNTSLEGNVVIDINASNLRLFELGGNYRGAHLDILECAGVDSTKLLHTANSAAVKIQETAPADTTALWVW